MDFIYQLIYWMILGIIPSVIIVPLMFGWLKKEVKDVPSYQFLIFIVILGMIVDLLGIV